MLNVRRFQVVQLSMMLLVVLQCAMQVEALFGRKKKLQKMREEAEKVRLAKLVVIFGVEINKTLFYVVTTLIAIGLGAALLLPLPTTKKLRGNRPDEEGTVDVVIVGCGLPKKGMGWYHLTQLLNMTNVNVRAVVEPFFMNEELCKEMPDSFAELVVSLTETGIEVSKSVNELSFFSKKTVCLIAGRTHDNPGLFRQCVDKGAHTIYLEKPGAPTVEELRNMASLAKTKNVQVYIGYNKNVTPYVQKTIALARETPNSHVFFCHNNSYTTADLPEVFSRNPEGMLKNMAIHELALLVTFFGVTVDSIDKFKINTSKLFSEKLSIWKPGTSLPNPEYITDFSRVAFKVTTKAGTNVSVMADRCGGNVSFAVVKDENGKEVKKFEFPDPETATQIEEKVLADPQMMPYFFVQSDDYLELKNRVITATLEGKKAEGVATIEVGTEALKLAEYATNQLNKALKAK